MSFSFNSSHLQQILGEKFLYEPDLRELSKIINNNQLLKITAEEVKLLQNFVNEAIQACNNARNTSSREGRFIPISLYENSWVLYNNTEGKSSAQIMSDVNIFDNTRTNSLVVVIDEYLAERGIFETNNVEVTHWCRKESALKLVCIGGTTLTGILGLVLGFSLADASERGSTQGKVATGVVIASFMTVILPLLYACYYFACAAKGKDCCLGRTDKLSGFFNESRPLLERVVVQTDDSPNANYQTPTGRH